MLAMKFLRLSTVPCFLLPIREKDFMRIFSFLPAGVAKVFFKITDFELFVKFNSSFS